MTTEAPILLDTCAAIWLMEGRLVPAAAKQFEQAYDSGVDVLVSPVTAWEIGLLVTRGRMVLTTGPERWFRQLVATRGVALAAMPPSVLVASSFLPGTPPRDPADRIIAASARELGFRVMTRDRLLLGYAEQGHLRAVAC